MGKYRPVDVRLWNDRKFLALSDGARLLWMYLLTSSSTISIPGVIVAGEAAMAEHLGWLPERFAERFRELEKAGLSVRREGRVTWLPNALKYQPPSNPNAVKAWAKSWDDVPECSMKHDIWQALQIACKSWSRLFAQLFAEPLANGSTNGSGNGSSNRSTQEQEQKQEQDQEQEQDLVRIPLDLPAGGLALESPVAKKSSKRRKPSDPTDSELASVRVVLGKLTDRNGVRYSGTAEHTRLIVAQLRNGVTEMELRAVIGYCWFELGWDDKPEMHKYLRPETLFGPKTIARYLDPARTWFAAYQAEEAKAAARAPLPAVDARNAWERMDEATDEEPDWMRGGVQ